MFIRFSLHKATAERVGDQPGDPFNRESELYQTWQLCTLDPLDPNDQAPKSNWARQGFSVTGAPEDGVGFGDHSHRVLDDPNIAFALKPEAIAEGKTLTYRLDIHWWESDGSSEQVRAAFSDSTLAVLVKAWKASADKEKAGRAALKSWIDGKSERVVKTAVRAASVTATSWVGMGFNALPLFEMIVDALKSESDDYITMHRFVIELKRADGNLVWRVIPPGVSIPEYRPVNSIQRIQVPYADAANLNAGVADYACLVLE
jgi:hypothetical protein